MDINVTVNDSYIKVVSPYNKDFVAKARRTGGRWNADQKAWIFDARDENRVRRLLIDIYGTDGHDTGETVTVRIDAGKHPTEQEILVGGTAIVKRRDRDQDPWTAPNTVIVSGSFHPSGGSRKYPALGENDAIIEVRDIPRAVAEHDGLDIVESTIDREALADERDRLTRRIEEINALLA